MNKTPVGLMDIPLKGVTLAAYRALEAQIPFVIYALPGKKRPSFMADISDRAPVSDKRFVIVPWLDRHSDGIVIRDTITASEFLKLYRQFPSQPSVAEKPCQPSTDKLVYKGQIYNAVDMLAEQQGGKVVISRIINESIPEGMDIGQVALLVYELFLDMDKDCLRYIYYTPETGCWMAATPELLLSYDKNMKYAYSMALAGTRKVSYSKPLGKWDEKNLYEHDLVLNEITETLADTGAKNIGVCERVLKYNYIEHRCHDIRFEHENILAHEYLDALNPTPALGGYPRSSALAMIEHLELHPRRCYGGYVSIEDCDKTLAYVNLRCAQFDSESVTIYAGGGITPDSKPEEEWAESESKAKHLLDALNVAFTTCWRQIGRPKE